MSLQEKLDQAKVAFEKVAPPAFVKEMGEATANLIASGLAERALKKGDVAPSFALADQDGNVYSSADVLKHGPLVLTFYRGAWCPYCNLDLQAFEGIAGDIRERGATLLAVSQQTAANSRKSHRDNKLSFSVLNDHGGNLAQAFGVRWDVPENLHPIHKALGADLTQFHGEHSWTLTMPARFVIGTDGVIAFSEVSPDYTRRPEPAEILPILDALVVR